nr:ATP-binding protein [Acidovorax sp. 106]
MALLDSKPSSDSEVLSVLERCMLDLRLIVDSMDGEGESVTERLARLRHRLQPVLERRGIQMTWDVQVFDGAMQLHGHCATHLVAIVQEALSNVLQHARATEVAVSVHYLAASGSWYAEVSDNGIGMDAHHDDAQAHAGSGIAGMHRRAELAGGQFSFLPRQGGGTCVWVIVPGGAADS